MDEIEEKDEDDFNGIEIDLKNINDNNSSNQLVKKPHISKPSPPSSPPPSSPTSSGDGGDGSNKPSSNPIIVSPLIPNNDSTNQLISKSQSSPTTSPTIHLHSITPPPPLPQNNKNDLKNKKM